jgi:hypothetical protein
MPDWPASRPPWWKEPFLRLAARPGPPPPPSAERVVEGGPSHASWKPDPLAPPTGVSVVPLKLIFLRAFRGAETDALRPGLAALHAKYPGGRSPVDTYDKLIAKELAGGWAALGTIKPGGTAAGGNAASGLAAQVHVRLHTLSASAAVLAFEVDPSDALKKRFAETIAKSPPASGPVWIGRSDGAGPTRWRLEVPTPRLLRKRAVEELFLELNREVSALAREHFGSAGPLPAIEVFLVERKETARPATDPEQEAFWQSLELPQRPGGFYRQDALTVYPAPWTESEHRYPRVRASLDAAALESTATVGGPFPASLEEAAALRLSMAHGWYDLQTVFAAMVAGLEGELFDDQGDLQHGRALAGLVREPAPAGGRVSLKDDWTARARKAEKREKADCACGTGRLWIAVAVALLVFLAIPESAKLSLARGLASLFGR